MVADWLFLLVVLAILGGLAFAGTTLVLRRTVVGIAAGSVLLVVAAIVPLYLAYTYSFGIAAEVVGVAVAVLRRRRGLTALGWALAAAAAVLVVAEPVVTLNVAQVQSEETYSRCAGDAAVAAIEKSRAEGHGYPVDISSVAQFDGEYGDTCYVNSSVHWLYRVAIPGTYTLGYWVDWHVTRHVCLHAARAQGWTCGFETWGPFKPGEAD